MGIHVIGHIYLHMLSKIKVGCGSFEIEQLA